jgi:hypothetical protein
MSCYERCEPQGFSQKVAKKIVATPFPAGEVRANMPFSRKNICCTT